LGSAEAARRGGGIGGGGSPGAASHDPVERIALGSSAGAKAAVEELNRVAEKRTPVSAKNPEGVIATPGLLVPGGSRTRRAPYSPWIAASAFGLLAMTIPVERMVRQAVDKKDRHFLDKPASLLVLFFRTDGAGARLPMRAYQGGGRRSRFGAKRKRGQAIENKRSREMPHFAPQMISRTYGEGAKRFHFASFRLAK
jgi:hypothetical protein